MMNSRTAIHTILVTSLIIGFILILYSECSDDYRRSHHAKIRVDNLTGEELELLLLTASRADDGGEFHIAYSRRANVFMRTGLFDYPSCSLIGIPPKSSNELHISPKVGNRVFGLAIARKGTENFAIVGELPTDPSDRPGRFEVKSADLERKEVHIDKLMALRPMWRPTPTTRIVIVQIFIVLSGFSALLLLFSKRIPTGGRALVGEIWPHAPRLIGFLYILILFLLICRAI